MKEQRRTKKQHHTPRFYLDAFATGPKRRRSIWVFDLRLKRWFESTPSAVGFVNDFYDVEGDHRDIIEEFYRCQEEISAPIICSVINDRQIPSERQLRGELLNFVGLQALRGPATRKNMSDTEVQLAEIIAERWVVHPKTLEATLLAIGTAPNELPQVAAQISDGLKKNQYKIVPAKESLIKSILELSEPIYATMWERKWELIVPVSEDVRFVTSDNPVVLTNLALSTSEEQYIINRAGFGTPGSSVIFPLSPHLAMHGLSKGIENRVVTDDIFVRQVNSRLVSRATRHIYSIVNDVHWI